MQSLNTAQSHDMRIRTVRKNKIWELALVGLVGLGLGVLLVWILPDTNSPAPGDEATSSTVDETTPDPARTWMELEPPSRLEDGDHRTLLKVNVQDRAGKAVPNQLVQLSSTEQTDTFQETTSTNQQGVALFPLTYSQPGERTLVVKSDGMQLLQQNIDLLTVPLPANPVPKIVGPTVTAHLLSTTPETGERTRATFELTVRNPDGSILGNEKIKITTDPQSRRPEVQEVQTDKDGKTSIKFTYKRPEKRTITVEQNGAEVGQAEIYLPKIEPRIELTTHTTEKPIVVPPPVTIEVIAATLQDNGHIRADLRITVNDEKGKPLGSIPLQMESSQNADTLTPPKSRSTDEQGKATAQLTSEQFGQRTIIVRSNARELGRASVYLPKLQTPIVEKFPKSPALPAPKHLVRLKVEGSDGASLTDATVKFDGKNVSVGEDDFFQQEVVAGQTAIEVEVNRGGYETPQGESSYRKSLPLEGVKAQAYLFQVYAFTVTLDPIRFYVELPEKELQETIPILYDRSFSVEKLDLKFLIKSPQDDSSMPVRLSTDRNRLWFPFTPWLNNGRHTEVGVEVWQGTEYRWGGNLPFERYKQTQP